MTTRPSELTTLQALDLTNGDVLANQLQVAAGQLSARFRDTTPDDVSKRLYVAALAREPNEEEAAVATEFLGDAMSAEALADLYWLVLMLPEFQSIR